MIHEQQRRIFISRVPQTNYATPTSTTQASNFVQLLVTDKNMAKHTVATGDNRDEAKGHEYPTDEWLLSHDVERPFDIAVSSQQIGRLLLLAFGSVVSQPLSLAPDAPVTHVYEPMSMAVSRQYPSASLVEAAGTAINRLFPSMVVSTLSIKGDGIDRLTSSVGLRGSGKVVTPSGLTAAQLDSIAPANLSYFFNSQANLTVADAGTLTNSVAYGTAKRLESWDFTVTNNLLDADGYRPGAGNYQTAGDASSGAVRSELLTGARDYRMSFVARLESQSDELAALRSRKKLDATIELTGGAIGASGSNHKLTIRAPRMSYEMVELGSKNGIVTCQITPRLLFDVASGRIVTVTLINDVASYAT